MEGDVKAQDHLREIYKTVFNISFAEGFEIKAKKGFTAEAVLDTMARSLHKVFPDGIVPEISASEAIDVYLKKIAADKEAVQQKIIAQIQLINDINGFLKRPELKVDPKTVSLGDITAAFKGFQNDDIKNYAANCQKAQNTDVMLLPSSLRKPFQDGRAIFRHEAVSAMLGSFYEPSF